MFEQSPFVHNFLNIYFVYNISAENSTNEKSSILMLIGVRTRDYKLILRN